MRRTMTLTLLPAWLPPMFSGVLAGALSVAVLVALGGCATLRQIDSDVSTYNQWPAERKPASYTFERLPSQQARPEQQQKLEDAARRAVEAAGFTRAAEASDADVTIQVGARAPPAERWVYDDPFWWRGGLYTHRRRGYHPAHWGFGGGFGGFGAPLPSPSYEREVVVLIRDRKTGQPLYEAQAANGGASASISSLLPALYEAALKDFPHAGVNPRRVSVELSP